MHSTRDEPRGPVAAHELCFVCCIESGILESLTLRLVESIRSFGGGFSKSPIVAVTPRRGPRLSRATVVRLRELDVEYIRMPLIPRYAWFNFLNKPAALAHVEEQADAASIAFVDSDVLVLGEPIALALPDGVDVIAAVPDIAVGATTGPGDEMDDAWRALCELCSVKLDDLPWVTTRLDRQQIRLCFQAGVFAYRRELGLGTAYRDAVISTMDGGIRLPGTAWTFLEQALLAPLVVGRGLRWRQLPFDHNLTMASYLTQYFRAEELRDARLVHYHDSMAPHFWPTFLERLAVDHASVGSWLEPLGPAVDEAPWDARMVRTAMRAQRGLRRRAHHVRADRVQ